VCQSRDLEHEVSDTGCGVDPSAIIDSFGMAPHPEGGHYVETWRGPDRGDGRATATAISFLLRSGERSHWHRVDADEIWLYHLGAPLRLSIVDAGGHVADHLLGPQQPQVLVPAHAWQAAEPTGVFTHVSCIVVPGFEFTGFELAPPGWQPG
jgi:predicted cupin superfamily sugar epimerase